MIRIIKTSISILFSGSVLGIFSIILRVPQRGSGSGNSRLGFPASGSRAGFYRLVLGFSYFLCFRRMASRRLAPFQNEKRTSPSFYDLSHRQNFSEK
ncbi:MAG TPA: hypothetical protein VIJ93_07380 [bacterium]